MDDVTERVGLGADGLVGGACDDITFCNAPGIMVVVGIALGMVDVCVLETILLVGGGIVVIKEAVEGTALPMTLWGTVEIGVELNKGCLNGPGGVLAATAAVEGGKGLLLDENGAFCIV